MEGKLARAESVEDDTKRGMKKLEDEGEDDDTKWPDASVGMGEKRWLGWCGGVVKLSTNN